MGLFSEIVDALTMSSEVAIKIDFFAIGISSTYKSRDTMFPPKGIGGFSREKMNPGNLLLPLTIVTFLRLPSI